jgi:hypothetical protein
LRVSTTTASDPARHTRDRLLAVYWWLAFGITWGIGGLGLLIGDIRPGRPSPLHPFHYLAAFGPSIAGLVMTARAGGGAAVRRLLARVVPRRPSFAWYVIVLIGFPALNLIGMAVLAPDGLGRVPRWNQIVALLPLTLSTDTGPLGEEFGWRGFALPRLLQRQPPLVAALLLGAIWWAWHLPTFFIPGLSQYQLSIPLFFVNVLALSVIMTWLYQRTRGDLLLMILIHVAANYCGWIGVPFNIDVGTEVACATLIVACGGLGWRVPATVSTD